VSKHFDPAPANLALGPDRHIGPLLRLQPLFFCVSSCHCGAIHTAGSVWLPPSLP